MTKPPLSEAGAPLQTHDERGPRFKRPTEVFYFGCGASHGHYWWEPQKQGREWGRQNSSTAADAMRKVFPRIDGEFPPKDTERAGVCTLTYRDGWSVLAWWDYSVDKRPRSNSVLVARGTHSFDEMMLLLNAEFSNVASRQLERMILTGTE